MSEEELKEVKGIVKRLYAGTGVTVGDILDTSCWLDKLVNEVEELQKENEQLQKRTKASQNFAKIVERDYIDKDEIKQLIGYEENEDVSKDEIIAELKTMWEEFNRLEDLEDFVATQCISKKKIKTKIKELEEELIQNYGTLGENLTTTEIKVLKELLNS